MQVTRYQMHNALECYRKKLSRVRGHEITPNGLPQSAMDRMVLSPETSRKAAMEKISRQVLDKITDVVALSSGTKSGQTLMRRIDGDAEAAREEAPAESGFPVMDVIDRKHSAALAVGDWGS
jgi:hypothetical protein